MIGNSGYAGAALPTAANDAGLIAQTLQAAGFDVTGARDLDATTLRSSFREFVDKGIGFRYRDRRLGVLCWLWPAIRR